MKFLVQTFMGIAVVMITGDVVFLCTIRFYLKALLPRIRYERYDGRFIREADFFKFMLSIYEKARLSEGRLKLMDAAASYLLTLGMIETSISDPPVRDK